MPRAVACLPRQQRVGIACCDGCRTVSRVVTAKAVKGGQPGSLRHELAVQFDDVNYRPELIENGSTVADLCCRDPARPLCHGDRGNSLDVRQARARDAVGAIPELATGTRGRLGDEERHQGRSVDVDDHRCCWSTRSLTVPAVLIGGGRFPFRWAAGVTLPSAISCSSLVGTPTGTIRATGGP